MLKAQRFVLNLLSVLLLLLAFVLIVQNLDVSVAVEALMWDLGVMSLGSVMALSGILMAGSILLRMADRLLVLRSQGKRATRELERKEVSREEAAEKVKVLEAKVQTLEKALSEALKQPHS